MINVFIISVFVMVIVEIVVLVRKGFWCVVVIVFGDGFVVGFLVVGELVGCVGGDLVLLYVMFNGFLYRLELLMKDEELNWVKDLFFGMVLDRWL